MNIETYFKPHKDIVIELDDEVEYLIDDRAVSDIKNLRELIPLKRLIDGKCLWISIERIRRALDNNGVVDYLDKKSG